MDPGVKGHETSNSSASIEKDLSFPGNYRYSGVNIVVHPVFAEMANIPFEITDNHGHIVTGLIYLNEEFVVFEVQVTKWSISKQPVETIKVEYGAVDTIRFKNGFFKDSIFVVPKRAALLDAVPGSHKGEIQLKIAKRYRDEAIDLITRFRLKKESRE